MVTIASLKKGQRGIIKGLYIGKITNLGSAKTIIH